MGKILTTVMITCVKTKWHCFLPFHRHPEELHEDGGT